MRRAVRLLSRMWTLLRLRSKPVRRTSGDVRFRCLVCNPVLRWITRNSI